VTDSPKSRSADRSQPEMESCSITKHEAVFRSLVVYGDRWVLCTLPSGGGALPGIGETFSPDLFTGTGNFTVPLMLPSGRSNFQPQLSLGYGTGTGNGPFGLGCDRRSSHFTRRQLSAQSNGHRLGHSVSGDRCNHRLNNYNHPCRAKFGRYRRESVLLSRCGPIGDINAGAG
jgi:hypothetical protein